MDKLLGLFGRRGGGGDKQQTLAMDTETYEWEGGLPSELVIAILALLPRRDLKNAALVNRAWHTLVVLTWKTEWQKAARPALGAQASREVMIVNQNANENERPQAIVKRALYPLFLTRVIANNVVELKVVLMGDADVGKTTLLNTLANTSSGNMINENTTEIPSCFSNFSIPALYVRKGPSVPSTQPDRQTEDLLFVSLWDTEMWIGPGGYSGHWVKENPSEGKRIERLERESEEIREFAGEDYVKMRRFTYPWTDVFLMCFAVDNETSLDNLITHWKKEIDNWAPEMKYTFILCGLKADARSGPKAKACVKASKAKRVAQQLGAIAYLECSARTGQGVRAVVGECVRQMYAEGRARPLTMAECTEHHDEEHIAEKPLRYFNAVSKRSWFYGLMVFI